MSENMIIQLEYTGEYEWLAFYQDHPCISAFGDNPSETVKELQIARKAAEESYRKHGESIPWKVKVMDKGIKLEIGKKYYVQLWDNRRDVVKAKLLVIGENFVVVKKYFETFVIKLDQVLGEVEHKKGKQR